MPKFALKQTTIAAEQFRPLLAPLPFQDQGICCYAQDGWHIHTPLGRLRIVEDDWIVQGNTPGDYYAVKPEVFVTLYDPIEGA